MDARPPFVDQTAFVTPEPDEHGTRLAARWPVAAGALVAVAALAVYANALGNGFVYDDDLITLQNPVIRSLTNVPAMFGHGFWMGGYSPILYRPVLEVLAASVYAVAGLAPWAHHLLNVLLHAAASVLVFLLAERVLPPTRGRTGAALAGALLFALHPIHVEAVTWVAGLSDLAFTVASLGALLLHARARAGAPRLLGLAAAAFALAALSKEPALALPVVLLALDLAVAPGRPASDRARWMAPYVAVAIGYVALRVSVLGAALAPPVDAEGSPLLRALALSGRYLAKLVAPVHLTAVYLDDPVRSLADPRVLVAIPACAAFAAAAAWAWRRSRAALLALALVAAPLAPVVAAAWSGERQIFAERYLYLPSAGLAIAAALALQGLLARRPRASVAAVAALALGCGGAVVARNRVWRSDRTLWTDVTRKTPGFAPAQAFVAFDLFRRERRDGEAREHFRAAMQADPAMARSIPESLNGFAIQELREGRTDEAVRELRLAIELAPGLAKAHANLGVAYATGGRVDEGIAELARAVELEPENAASRANLERARSMRAARDGAGPRAP
ncbi:MAG TPA: tetratricopeptide repeat protein [Anaeromyxobacter sp.]